MRRVTIAPTSEAWQAAARRRLREAAQARLYRMLADDLRLVATAAA